MIIKHIQKDLLSIDPSKSVYAHCVAVDGAMGAGIAKTLTTAYPTLREQFKNLQPKLGDAIRIETDNAIIYNLVTKPVSSQKPLDHNAMAFALQNMKHQMQQHQEQYVAMPLIGAGLDRLDWNKTQEVMTNVFKNTNIAIGVCHLGSLDGYYNVKTPGPKLETMAQNESIESSQLPENPDGYLMTDHMFAFYSPASIFSNLALTNFIHDGHTFKTSEAAFMYEKAKLFGDVEIAQQIIDQSWNPVKCKQLGRNVKNFDNNIWDQHKFDIMTSVLSSKFSTPENKKMLLLTGNRALIEASPYDRTWGMGLSKEDIIEGRKAGYGQNLMGKALQHVRETIKQTEPVYENNKTATLTENKGYRMALTGHRPKDFQAQNGNVYDTSDPVYTALYNELRSHAEEKLKEPGKITIISGMALGADTVWAQVAANMKDDYGFDKVRLEAHSPIESHDGKWQYESKQLYRNLLSYTDEVVYYAPTYSAQAMQLRNIGMIENSDELVAAYNGYSTEKSGTYNAVNYARTHNKNIYYTDTSYFKPQDPSMKTQQSYQNNYSQNYHLYDEQETVPMDTEFQSYMDIATTDDQRFMDNDPLPTQSHNFFQQKESPSIERIFMKFTRQNTEIGEVSISDTTIKLDGRNLHLGISHYFYPHNKAIQLFSKEDTEFSLYTNVTTNNSLCPVEGIQIRSDDKEIINTFVKEKLIDNKPNRSIQQGFIEILVFDIKSKDLNTAFNILDEEDE